MRLVQDTVKLLSAVRKTHTPAVSCICNFCKGMRATEKCSHPFNCINLAVTLMEKITLDGTQCIVNHPDRAHRMLCDKGNTEFSMITAPGSQLINWGYSQSVEGAAYLERKVMEAPTSHPQAMGKINTPPSQEGEYLELYIFVGESITFV
jgi:hypothetical protein